MSTIELQNILIRKILDIDKIETLEQIDTMLHKLNPNAKVQLSNMEEAFIQQSLKQIKEGKIRSNEDVFEQTEKWLEE